MNKCSFRVYYISRNNRFQYYFQKNLSPLFVEYDQSQGRQTSIPVRTETGSGAESPYSLFMRRRFQGSYPLKPARYPRSNRAEYLLIYRIPSHTNPKRRDFSLKQPGQKSAKEEGPEQRKGPKRAVNGSLKVQTHIWEHDVGCSSHLTPTRKSRC